jgi:MoaA/NifB/PqqE/SkfB family radical SAM enzyme
LFKKQDILTITEGQPTARTRVEEVYMLAREGFETPNRTSS